jgi:hypothetical protein
LKTVEGGGGVVNIEKSAFTGSSKLTSLPHFPSLKTIGNYAFQNCTSISEFIMPNTVTTIGYEAFIGCSSLESIQLSENLNLIDNKTFYGCKNLKSITIPESVTVIKSGAFVGCSNLSSVYFQYQDYWVYSMDGANGGVQIDVTNQYSNAQSLKNESSWGRYSLKKW